MYLCILLSLLSSAQGQIVWAEENCNTDNTNPGVVYGEPTDAVCCNATRPAGVDILMCADKMDESLCENIEEEMELEECLVKMCEKEDKCIWRQGECKPNRDLENNVCCPPEHVIKNCQHILRGECPPDWRIPRQCCPPPYDKYRQRLETGAEDTVCCNAPCKAIELAWTGNATRGIQPNETCTADLSTNCGPAKRSALMSGAMNPFLLSQMMGMPTTGGSGGFGQNNQFFGSMDSLLGGQFGMMMGLMGDMGVTETEPVEEITVDDFFDALIVALDNDKDVYEYQSDTYSHPFFGKMVSVILLRVKRLSFISPFFSLVYGWFQSPDRRFVGSDDGTDGTGRLQLPRPKPVHQPHDQLQPLRLPGRSVQLLQSVWDSSERIPAAHRSLRLPR